MDINEMSSMQLVGGIKRRVPSVCLTQCLAYGCCSGNGGLQLGSYFAKSFHFRLRFKGFVNKISHLLYTRK